MSRGVFCVSRFTPRKRKETDVRCSEEVIVEQPLLCVDRQMGLNIVHPEGKVCTAELT
jgi:hypothetical protein